MDMTHSIENSVKDYLQKKYEVTVESFEFQQTRKEFEGDITLVVFPLLRYVKTNPVKLGEELGEHLVKDVEQICAFNVIKGFLNLSFTNSFFVNQLEEIITTQDFGTQQKDEKSDKMMVEFSSPNTNKPLHLGHVRNNLLGHSVSEILKANGKEVFKTQIINDRGIHICKSMLAWQKFGQGETPESTEMKGDHFVGKYYVIFDQKYKVEIKELIEKGHTEEEAKKQAPLLLEAQKLLKKWEENDTETVALWQKMNNWVYEGFEKTYSDLGVDFDKNYYESETYILGKEFVLKGLKDGIFYKKEDGSIWVDLSEDGLDEKLLLRADGTSVYITQDIGTAIQRVKDFQINGLVYTVGNEQDYHFKVLFLILKKLGFAWAEHLYHLSYGMVELPDGKMKSREGTVVDADQLIEEMVTSAQEIAEELGKIDDLEKEEKQKLYQAIGKGALKYFILKVDPRKNMLFDPKESIDFQGNTGPFIQYTHARIQSLKRKANIADFSVIDYKNALDLKEKDIIKHLLKLPSTIAQAGDELNPALICNYTYDLVKLFNSFYQNSPIIIEDKNVTQFRISIADQVAKTIALNLNLLGIESPQRM
ncbi:arginine--tRNA ligase [Psychroflexus halocasei]|uniref:Arginine--tRNA ligase n=1 Tax=Psychroflexus halocasei TaxID=908615 RepID=A0A1H3YPI4_9FLAO|nr:arginine--tRNA ligase [Psychroflexus halocasei]SEA13430.1 arginyl-tRNA synthetase [Psychroflexus halocasei]